MSTDLIEHMDHGLLISIFPCEVAAADLAALGQRREAALLLARNGWSDGRAGVFVGARTETVCRWRKASGVAANSNSDIWSFAERYRHGRLRADEKWVG